MFPHDVTQAEVIYPCPVSRFPSHHSVPGAGGRQQHQAKRSPRDAAASHSHQLSLSRKLLLSLLFTSHCVQKCQKRVRVI